jgi:hypothetical protein
MVHALFLSVFCDIHEESFFAEFFFIYIYVGLQSRSELERIFLYIPPPGT